MVVFVTLAVIAIFFLGSGFLVARLVWSTLRIRDISLRIGIFCLVTWAIWQHFQLPPNETGGGYYLAHTTDGQVALPVTDRAR
jgi:hypothetical protein